MIRLPSVLGFEKRCFEDILLIGLSLVGCFIVDSGCKVRVTTEDDCGAVITRLSLRSKRKQGSLVVCFSAVISIIDASLENRKGNRTV